MNKQERVYTQVRERILTGAYGPGYRLVIDGLAQEFNVSALPVREAIRRLEAEGLVMFRPNLGAQVAPADPDLFADTLTTLAVLEGFATALSAPHLDEKALAAADRVTDRMAVAAEEMDVIGVSAANTDFHHLLTERCDNPPLLTLLGDTERRMEAIRRTVFTHIPHRVAHSIADHREIVKQIRAGASAERVERLVRAHKLRTVEAFSLWRESHLVADGAAAESSTPVASSAG